MRATSCPMIILFLSFDRVDGGEAVLATIDGGPPVESYVGDCGRQIIKRTLWA